MLAGLRNAAKSKWAAPIIVVLALSFAIWGVNDMFRGGPRDAVAVVGPEKVTAQEFSDEFNRRVQTIARQNEGRFTAQDARDAGLDRQILSEMITMASLDAQAGNFGLGASDRALFEEIQSIEAFRDPVRNEFNRDQYRSQLAQLQMSERQFENAVRGDIIRQQLIRAVTAGESAPASFAERRQAFAGESRRADVLVLAPSLAEEIGDPTDAQLQDIIDSNQSAFTQPERRAVTVAWLSPSDFEQTVDVTEEQIEELYEFRKDSFAEAATRSYVQIQLPGEEEASAVAARINDGETAEAVADSVEADLVQAEAASADDIVDSEIADALFAMSAEDPARVVEGRFGWSVVDVTAAVDAETPAIEDVRDELRSELAADTAIENMYDAISAFEDARGAGAPIEDAATEAEIVAMSYLPVTRQGRGAEGETFAKLMAAPQVLELAFQMQEGETSALEDLGDQGFAVVRVDRVNAEELVSLAEARPAAEQVWRSQQLQENMEAVASEAAERAENGEAFSDIAADIGAGASVESVTVTRGQTAGAAGPRLVGALFEAAPGEVVTAPSAQGGQAVAALREISVDPGAESPSREEMANEVTQDLLTQFQLALQQQYEVKTYPDQIAFALGDDVTQ